MISDNIEKIIMTKEDYDRNVEQLLIDKCKAEQEIERLNSIIKEAKEYIDWHYDLATDENVEFCLLRDRLLDILDKDNK